MAHLLRLCVALSLTLAYAWTPSLVTSNVGLKRSLRLSSAKMPARLRQCTVARRKTQMLISAGGKVVATIDPQTLESVMKVLKF